MHNWSNPKENWGQQDWGDEIHGVETQIQGLLTDIACLILNVDANQLQNILHAIRRHGEEEVRRVLGLALAGWKR